MSNKKIALLKQLDPRFDPTCELCMLNYGHMTIKQIKKELRGEYD